MTSPVLSLVVARSVHPPATVDFYRALGCNFREERHASGPLHYSCVLGSLVFEIYPRDCRDAKSDATTLGFDVKNLDDTLASLAAQGVELKAPAQSTEWGRTALLCDPDGRRVRLTEPGSTSSVS